MSEPGSIAAQPPHDPGREERPPSPTSEVLAAAFCGLLLVANVAATKLIGLGPLVFDGGALVFPLTYVLGDVLAEVYGFKTARRAIVTGFVLSALAALSFWLVDLAPAGGDWPNRQAWHAVLGLVPRIVAASLAGYLVGQLLNARVLVWWRDRTRPGSLWSRLLGSTAVGAAADTVLFCALAYGGAVSGATLAVYTVTGYLYKLAVEAVLLPVTVLVVRRVKAREPTP